MNCIWTYARPHGLDVCKNFLPDACLISWSCFLLTIIWQRDLAVEKLFTLNYLVYIPVVLVLLINNLFWNIIIFIMVCGALTSTDICRYCRYSRNISIAPGVFLKPEDYHKILVKSTRLINSLTYPFGLITCWEVDDRRFIIGWEASWCYNYVLSMYFH